MKQTTESSFSKHASHNHLKLNEVVGNVLEDKKVSLYDCPHYDYCVVKKFGNINCITESSVKTCPTYKFYNRYGKDYNEFGVGSKI